MFATALIVGSKVFWALIYTLIYVAIVGPLFALGNVIRKWSEKHLENADYYWIAGMALLMFIWHLVK